jgi:thiol-disulfide isomerase/thioredoxin
MRYTNPVRLNSCYLFLTALYICSAALLPAQTPAPAKPATGNVAASKPVPETGIKQDLPKKESIEKKGSKTGKAYSIKVKINGLQDSTCFLASYYAEYQSIQDTARADKNGTLVFNGKKKLESGMYMVVKNKRKLFDFLVLDSDQHFALETDTIDYNGHMKVTGSAENKLFFEYLNWLGKKQMEAEKCRKRLKEIKSSNKDSATIIENSLSGMDKEVKAYMNDFMQKNSGTFTSKFFKATLDIEIPPAPLLPIGRRDTTFGYRYYKAHFFDNIDLADERLLRTPVYTPKLKQYFETMVLQTPDSIIAEGDMIISKASGNKETFKYCVGYMTYTYEISKVMGFDAIFVHEALTYYKTGKAFWTDEKQTKKIVAKATQLDSVLLGRKAPNLIMQDSLVGLSPDFNTYSLNNLKSKYTILYFWDPDCGHCQKETPKLHEFYKKIQPKYQIEVYAVGVVSELGPWRKYIREKKLSWINVVDAFNKTHYKHIYDVYSTPVMYILDENKIIIAKRLDTDQIEEFLDRYEKMLKQKADQARKQGKDNK